jgi:hypothetical protein
MWGPKAALLAFVLGLLPLNCLGVVSVAAAENPSPAPAAAASDLVPLVLDLPKPAFVGTPPVDLPTNGLIEPYDPKKPRSAMLVPRGLKNLALGSKLSCSDTNASTETLKKIIDEDKDPYDESIIFLKRGTQWVQIDLGSPRELYAVVIWHAHNILKVYHDVIVQASDDPEFKQSVRTLFNNDQDNSSGLGIGTDREYFETCEGKLINAKGLKARYLRFYSRGSTNGGLNEYTEIEVYGRPGT